MKNLILAACVVLALATVAEAGGHRERIIVERQGFGGGYSRSAAIIQRDVIEVRPVYQAQIVERVIVNRPVIQRVRVEQLDGGCYGTQQFIAPVRRLRTLGLSGY
jgi:hypothetical protein